MDPKSSEGAGPPPAPQTVISPTQPEPVGPTPVSETPTQPDLTPSNPKPPNETAGQPASSEPSIAGESTEPASPIDGSSPETPQLPDSQPPQPSTEPDPQPTMFAPDNPSVAPVKGGKSGKKKFIIALVVLLVLLGGAAAAYFGYWMNPKVVYSQALGNTSKGYDKIIDYAAVQAKANYKTTVATGSYKVSGGGFDTDGKINLKSSGDNGELTFDVGVAGSRVNTDIRLIKSSEAGSPDIYAKVDGLDALGVLTGSPELSAALTKLNGQWIVVDHTLIDTIQKSAGQTAPDKMKQPTSDQVVDAAKAFGKVNQDYLFTTNKDKAVLKVTKQLGSQTVDGHKIYGYQVALVKNNVKAYLKAQEDGLMASQLGVWIKQNGYEKAVKASFDDMIKSTDSIKDSDTFEIWADTSQRIIYKVRLPDDTNPAANYVDIGLGYKGGDVYPFFLDAESKDKSGGFSFKLTASVNTKTNVTNLTLDAKSTGSDKFTASGSMTVKSSNNPVSINKPASAVPLSQALQQLGYGDLLNSYVQTAQAAAAAGSSQNLLTQ